MPPVIPILFAAVLGFGLGYKLKDCLCKKDTRPVQPNIKIQAYPEDTPNVPSSPRKESGFSLHSLDKLFIQYNIQLTSDYSFTRLLDAIEQNSYVSLLKHIDEQIQSPKELFQFLEDEKLNISNFDIGDSRGEPYISQDSVNAILESKHVNHSHLKTIEEKIKFLLILAQGKGTKRFQESFGNDLATFLNKYRAEEKTDVVFDGIKSTVHNRLEFLS